MKDRDKMAVGVRFELTEDSTPSSVFKTDGLNRAHPSHYEIENDMAFLFRKVMSLEYDMDSRNYSWWLATVLRKCYVTGFSSPPVGTYFVLQACHQALAFLLPQQERNANKETSLKLNQRPELFGMNLLGIVTPSM